ncbi:MAG: hypothetical protein Q9M36_13070 [Sulfurovum sp.]|nr:hypothetical protein [Sulfurovum sp.]
MWSWLKNLDEIIKLETAPKEVYRAKPKKLSDYGNFFKDKDKYQN